MSNGVNKILIVTKPDDENASSLGAEMTDFLSEIGVFVEVCEHRPDSCEAEEKVAGQYDLILVLGGDGTFIGVARRMLPLAAPLMGVNLGRVGFLAQIHRDHWKQWLSSVVSDGLNVSRRLVLEYEVTRRGVVIHTGLAVNDLVISRGVLARLIRLGVGYNKLDLSTFRADGLIISTPTGSSAYGVSAGGPLMYADLLAYCVTPVCPFLNSFKPMVFPADGECVVRVEEAGGEVNLTEDGQSLLALEHGDEICVRRCPTDLLVVNLGTEAYFDKLKKHGFLTEK